MSKQRLIVDESQIVETDIRYCEAEYHDRFGLDYDARMIGTPEVLLTLEHLRKVNEQRELVTAAQAQLEEKAKGFTGIDKEAAMARARKALPGVAKDAEEEIVYDYAATSRVLSRLVVWLGITSNGKLHEPTEAYFRDKHFDFHGAIMTAIFEDFGRPTSGSVTELPEPSSVTENGDSLPSNIEPSEPPALQEFTTTAN